MLPLQLLSHELLPQRRDEEKEKTLFTKSIFPSLVGIYAIHVTGIFYHISVDLSINLENLTKYYCFGVYGYDCVLCKRSVLVSREPQGTPLPVDC